MDTTQERQAQQSGQNDNSDQDNGNHEFSSDFDALKSSFNQLRNDVTDLIHNAMSVGQSGAGAVQDKAARAVDGIKDQSGQIFEMIEEHITNHPVAAAAIAIGVGFVLAKVLSRKSS